jgi:hypothetical protein
LPSLTDLITVGAAGGTALGVLIAFLFRAESDRELLENLAIGTTLGGACAVLVAVAFGAWLAD